MKITCNKDDYCAPRVEIIALSSSGGPICQSGGGINQPGDPNSDPLDGSYYPSWLWDEE